MPDINLRQLEAFHAIAETGSVTAAARMLHVTQPAISTVLKHLEQRLQFKLFERIGGRLRPTPEALTLMPDVAEIFGRVRSLGRTAEAMRDGLAGRVVVACSPTLVDSMMPIAIARFRQANPGVTINLLSLATSLTVERVARRDADLGIAYGPIGDPAVEVQELARSEIACVLPRGHFLAERDDIEAADLVGQPIITLAPSSKLGNVGALIAERCEAAGVPRPEPVIEPSRPSRRATWCGLAQGLDWWTEQRSCSAGSTTWCSETSAPVSPSNSKWSFQGSDPDHVRPTNWSDAC